MVRSHQYCCWHPPELYCQPGPRALHQGVLWHSPEGWGEDGAVTGLLPMMVQWDGCQAGGGPG
jgi:hypothetical protein